MDIAIDDEKACEIKLLIDNKQNYLENRIRELKKMQKENVFLTEVVDDYINYFKIINKQNIDQYNALRKISEHIDSIHQTSDITEQLLRESKQDQREILNRMKYVKGKIDNINNILEL